MSTAVRRGDIWWADLGDPVGSAPGYRRPVLVIQADGFNRSLIATTIVVILSSNLRLLDAPGNVLISAGVSGLGKDSVANISQILTLDRSLLTARVGKLPMPVIRQVERGVRLVLQLDT